MAIPKWTKEEKGHLASLDDKLSQIRDGVRGVVKEFHTGFFLHGEGGTSKSYTVLETLQQLKAKYVLHNTRLTARGLVDSLEQCPTDCHFIEDAETLMEDKKSFGVLRSALWSQSKQKPPVREITWTAFKTTIRFEFTGSLIVISNVNLAEEVPEIRAIKTRIKVLGLDVSNMEARALMKQICGEGYTYGEYYMTPDECWGVAEFIIAELGVLNRNLDLRLMMNGFKDYLQWKAGHSDNHWHTLLKSRMAERIVYKSRSEVKADDQKIALEIYAMKIPAAQKYKLFHERTGLSEKAFYRALKRRAK